jgi:predicted DNA-binding protein (MmcQ/YjbR family)
VSLVLRAKPGGPFEAQRALAASLKAATEDIKWEVDLVYSVGGKMFCVFLLDTETGQVKSVGFKVDAERFLELTGVPGVGPAPYLARAKWVKVKPGHALGSTELNALVRRSYNLVAERLTKKLQTELGILA